MPAEWMLQYTEPFHNEQSAKECLSFLALQVDYLGGRIVPWSPTKPWWVAQGFFKDAPASWYPDGIRRVIMLDNLRKECGLSC